MAKKIRNKEIAAAVNTSERSKLIDLKDKQEREFKKQQAEAVKARNAESERIKAAIANVAKTEDGKTVFRLLMDSCGANTHSCIHNANTGEVPKDLMLINNSKRDLWIDIRTMIPVADLVAIEHGVKVVPVEQ